MRQMVLKHLRAKVAQRNEGKPEHVKRAKVDVDEAVVLVEQECAYLQYLIGCLESVRDSVSKDFTTVSRAITAIQSEQSKAGRVEGLGRIRSAMGGFRRQPE